jgi:hypothetical protein
MATVAEVSSSGLRITGGSTLPPMGASAVVVAPPEASVVVGAVESSSPQPARGRARATAVAATARERFTEHLR